MTLLLRGPHLRTPRRKVLFMARVNHAPRGRGSAESTRGPTRNCAPWTCAGPPVYPVPPSSIHIATRGSGVRSNGINRTYHPLRSDVVNHMRAAGQDIEATASHLAVQALRLPVANDLVRVSGEHRRRREQRSIPAAQALRR